MKEAAAHHLVDRDLELLDDDLAYRSSMLSAMFGILLSYRFGSPLRAGGTYNETPVLTSTDRR